LIQQLHGEVLTLIGQSDVVDVQFVLHLAQFSQFPAQFKGGEYRIVVRQSDEERTRQGAVGVDARARVVEAVLRLPADAPDAPAADVVRLLDRVSAVQEYPEDLVVVAVRREDYRRDVGRVGVGGNSSEKILKGADDRNRIVTALRHFLHKYCLLSRLN